jgi:glycosyltransferase involved in cell wall biosynthesis
MSNKFVSVIVPAYNDWARLRLCVDALAAQTYPNEWFDVVIVNNNPNDSAPVGFTLPANFKNITEAKPGSYSARNAGLRIVKGEIIGFTDADCIPGKDWIKNAVAHFEDNPGCSRIAGNLSLFPKGKKATLDKKYDALYTFRQKKICK